MKTIHYIYAAAIALSAVGCTNDGFYYQDTARVRIEGVYEWAVGSDSIVFSFAPFNSSTTEKDMEMTLFVMGEPAEHDRMAKLEVDAGKTTAAASQYALPTEVVVAAGKYSAKFNVTLKRTADLVSKNVTLRVNLVPTNDFQVGVNEQSHFSFKWNDMLSKPKNWDADLVPYFGDYSLTKYRFIIDVTGKAEFSIISMSWAELNNYKIMLVNALVEYNNSHPGNLLTDENGKLVTF